MSISPPQPFGDDLASSQASAANAFGLELYGKVRSAAGNLALSPLSVFTALTMVAAGARGRTADEMARALHVRGTAEDDVRAAARLAARYRASMQPVIRLASRLFGDPGYRYGAAYLDLVRSAFDAPLERLAFAAAPEAARTRINAWIAERTEGRIKDLLPMGAVDRQTRLVLANAIYFLGDWSAPFDPEATEPAPFRSSRADATRVPTMHQTGRFPFAEVNGTKLLELPYRGGELAMLFALPRGIDGVTALEEQLNGATLDAWTGALAETRVAVALPKFTLEPEGVSLATALRRLGMSLAFDPAWADFTGIADPPSPDERLFLGDVFHKAFVKVDERGTEAAAATGAVMSARSVEARPVEFAADHPFLFLLRDRGTGTILFMGRVMDPSPSGDASSAGRGGETSDPFLELEQFNPFRHDGRAVNLPPAGADPPLPEPLAHDPESGSGSRYGSRYGARTESGSGSRYGVRTESGSGSQYGSRYGVRTESGSGSWYPGPVVSAEAGAPGTDDPGPYWMRSVVDLVDGGNALWAWRPVDVTFQPPGSKQSVIATFWVFVDAMKDRETGRRWPTSAAETQMVADRIRVKPQDLPEWWGPPSNEALPCLLMTNRLSDARWLQARQTCEIIPPHPQSTTDLLLASSTRMNQAVDRDVASLRNASPWVADPGKLWILHRRIWDGTGAGAVNYAWHVEPTAEPLPYPVSDKTAIRGCWVVQSAGGRHPPYHIDYSQLLMLCAPWCMVARVGQDRKVPMRTADVYMSRELAGLVTDDGLPLPGVRQPFSEQELAAWRAVFWKEQRRIYQGKVNRNVGMLDPRPADTSNPDDAPSTWTPRGWTLLDPDWLPTRLYGRGIDGKPIVVPFNMNDPAHIRAMRWSATNPNRRPDLPDVVIRAGILYDALGARACAYPPLPSDETCVHDYVGWYLDETWPARGMETLYGATGERALAAPPITPASGPNRGRVAGYPIDPMNWSKGIKEVLVLERPGHPAFGYSYDKSRGQIEAGDPAAAGTASGASGGSPLGSIASTGVAVGANLLARSGEPGRAAAQGLVTGAKIGGGIGAAGAAAGTALAAAGIIGATTAALSVVPVIGTVAGAVIGTVAALAYFLGKDTFHPSPLEAQQLLALFRADPGLLFAGVDKLTARSGNRKHAAEELAARLVRYLKLIAGEVPLRGPLYNPVSNDSCKNPYLCTVDRSDPLTDPAVLRLVKRQVELHRATPPHINTPAQAAAVLAVLRTDLVNKDNVLGWDAVKKNLPALRREVAYLRRLAGENGHDPVLSRLLGGDLGAGQRLPLRRSA